MHEFFTKCVEILTKAGGKIIFAVIVLVAGCIVIKGVKKLLSRA